MHNLSACSATPDVQFISALSTIPEVSSCSDQLEALILNQLKQKYGDAVYRSWFAHLKFEGIVDNELVIFVPTKFIREWINNNYLDSINMIACSVAPVKNVIIKVGQSLPSPTKHVQQPDDKSTQNFSLDPQLIFENFIVADSNKVAYSMAMAFAKNKQTSNLLYIQSNVSVN